MEEGAVRRREEEVVRRGRRAGGRAGRARCNGPVLWQV